MAGAGDWRPWRRQRGATAGPTLKGAALAVLVVAVAASVLLVDQYVGGGDTTPAGDEDSPGLERAEAADGSRGSTRPDEPGTGGDRSGHPRTAPGADRDGAGDQSQGDETGEGDESGEGVPGARGDTTPAPVADGAGNDGPAGGDGGGSGGSTPPSGTGGGSDGGSDGTPPGGDGSGGSSSTTTSLAPSTTPSTTTSTTQPPAKSHPGLLDGLLCLVGSLLIPCGS